MHHHLHVHMCIHFQKIVTEQSTQNQKILLVTPIHRYLALFQLPERQQLASFTKEAGKFAFLLKEHPPTVTSVPKLIGRKSRNLRKREILNSARNMPAPQLLRSHLAYCRELKKGYAYG